MTTERTKKFSKRAQEKSSLTASLTKGVLKVLQLCRPSKRRSVDQGVGDGRLCHRLTRRWLLWLAARSTISDYGNLYYIARRRIPDKLLVLAVRTLRRVLSA